MTQAPASERVNADRVDERDPQSLKKYLLSFDWPFRNEAVHQMLVDGGLPLWMQVLRFVPNRAERGKALELGSPPFHITLMLQRFRNYDLSLTGAAADGRPEIKQTLDSAEFGERYDFTCQCFDIENDRFPYPDNTFDLVTWVEVIEHLTKDPVHALAEIHRVLKPGGVLVLSTPNASRADSIANFLAGRNIYDPYHLGAPLMGSRHSREYTLAELRGLLEGCGFKVNRAQDIDIYPARNRKLRAFRFLLQNVVARRTKGNYRFHLFVRAHKTDQPFRWNFPAGLFDLGHLAFHMAPQDSRVVMGENDVIHISFGWGPLETDPDGTAFRRCSDVGDIYLRTEGPVSRVRVRLRNAKGKVETMHDNNVVDLVRLGAAPVDAGATWQEIEVPVSAEQDPAKRLHVRLDVPGGADVQWAEAG